jgi:hypothetical protein
MKPGTHLAWWQVGWLAQLGGYLNCVPFWIAVFAGLHLRAPYHTILFFTLAVAWAFLIAKIIKIIIRGLTPSSTRTPPALPGALSLLLAFSAPFIASVQAGPVSFIR